MKWTLIKAYCLLQDKAYPGILLTTLFLLNAPALLNASIKIFKKEPMLEAYLPLPAQKCVQSRHFASSSPWKNMANISTYLINLF